MNFVTSELHKLVFTPLLSPTAPEGAKAFAREKADLRFEVLDEHFTDNPVVVTIPLFTFVGYVLAEAKTPDRLVAAARFG